MTKLVLPGMILRKRGLILTVGSFAALIPSPLLAVYSGSKAFVSTWSQALGSELKGTGVEVQVLNTYFVVRPLPPLLLLLNISRGVGEKGIKIIQDSQEFLDDPHAEHLCPYVPIPISLFHYPFSLFQRSGANDRSRM